MCLKIRSNDLCYGINARSIELGHFQTTFTNCLTTVAFEDNGL